MTAYERISGTIWNGVVLQIVKERIKKKAEVGQSQDRCLARQSIPLEHFCKKEKNLLLRTNLDIKELLFQIVDTGGVWYQSHQHIIETFKERETSYINFHQQLYLHEIDVYTHTPQ